MKDRKQAWGKLKADPTKHVPPNSPVPVEYYEDIEFRCIDCGKHQIWTDEQQKVYYERWKKPIYHTAVRCLECRKARRAAIRENTTRTIEGLKRRQLKPQSNESI